MFYQISHALMSHSLMSHSLMSAGWEILMSLSPWANEIQCWVSSERLDVTWLHCATLNHRHQCKSLDKVQIETCDFKMECKKIFYFSPVIVETIKKNPSNPSKYWHWDLLVFWSSWATDFQKLTIFIRECFFSSWVLSDFNFVMTNHTQ